MSKTITLTSYFLNLTPLLGMKRLILDTKGLLLQMKSSDSCKIQGSKLAQMKKGIHQTRTWLANVRQIARQFFMLCFTNPDFENQE
jgi:hypothetical protein